MNTRGGPGIVLASVAYAAGIIDERMFTALVIASILTSLATGLWLRWRLVRNPDAFELPGKDGLADWARPATMRAGSRKKYWSCGLRAAQ